MVTHVVITEVVFQGYYIYLNDSFKASEKIEKLKQANKYYTIIDYGYYKEEKTENGTKGGGGKVEHFAKSDMFQITFG